MATSDKLRVSEMTQEEKINKLLDLLTEKTEDPGLEGIHREEHEYLRLLIEEHRSRKEAWVAIRNRVVSGTIWAAIVGTFTAIAFTIKAWLTGNF